MPSLAHPALGTSRTVTCFRHRRAPVKFRYPPSDPLATLVLLFDIFTLKQNGGSY